LKYEATLNLVIPTGRSEVEGPAVSLLPAANPEALYRKQICK
jgi:hypothetical protein